MTSLWHNRKAPLYIAHRGARSLAPENTLAAAEKAVQTGAHGWELDVQMTKDGRLAVIHDKNLDRTSNVSRLNRFADRRPWPTHKFTLEELKSLDFGSWFQETDPFGQIEAKAIRKLRHPKCSRKLRDYLG